MIESPVSVTEPRIQLVEQKPAPLKLDLACGEAKEEGFTRVDLSKSVNPDVIHDLGVAPWPFEDESVDEARCTHFLEHLEGGQQITFMNELWRVLKPEAKCLIVVPHYLSARAWQDPTHKRPVPPEAFLYYNRKWREDNKLTHYPITANFDAVPIGFEIPQPWSLREENARAFAVKHYNNVANDLHVTVVKKP